ncbi:MAG: hypothetical protein ACOY0T_05885 [Myxococcota bacterium]
MTRQLFLGLSSVVALAVAAIALFLPHGLLIGKGVEPDALRVVWVREVGALILAVGVTTLLVRKAPDSVALRGVLIGNAVVHFALLPIEIAAFIQGAITKLEGIVPNSLLHVALGTGFVLYARRVHVS